MDIKRAPQHTPYLTKTKQLTIAGLLLIGLIIWLFSQPRADIKISKSDLWTGTVQTGVLQQEVQGFGKLQSKKQWLLTAPIKSTVKEILLKPGAQVNADSVILQLQNPELEQDIMRQRVQLKAAEANKRQQKVNLKREALSQQGTLAQLEADAASAALKLESMTALVSEGIVSQLDYKSAKLNKQQLEKRLEIERQRLMQLAEVHKESLNIQQEQINQQQQLLDALLNKQQLLSVRAGIDGILQQLPIELGESVADGQKLALVGSMTELQAQVKIPQSQVEQIQLGQSVDINTRGDRATGIIARIDPVVNDGTVLVEIDLVGDLPSNARPELNIDAVILTGTAQHTQFIERPANAQSGSTMTLFKIDQQNGLANAVQVTFGMQTGNLIEIISGAEPGSQFILSDTSKWSNENTLIIN